MNRVGDHSCAPSSNRPLVTQPDFGFRRHTSTHLSTVSSAIWRYVVHLPPQMQRKQHTVQPLKAPYLTLSNINLTTRWSRLKLTTLTRAHFNGGVTRAVDGCWWKKSVKMLKTDFTVVSCCMFDECHSQQKNTLSKCLGYSWSNGVVTTYNYHQITETAK